MAGREIKFSAAIALCLAFGRLVPALAANGVNVAKGRVCSFQPPPNYTLTTDAGDATQLTDGRHASGILWTQRDSVGWVNMNYVFITLDLGADTPIAGASFNTAAGSAGVLFPSAIIVLVSTNGQAWHEVGDLVAESTGLHGAPPTTSYTVRRFWTDQWQVHGRWVAFLVDVNGPLCFVDEVEVYEGQPQWNARPLPGPPVADLMSGLARHRARRRIDADAQRLSELLDNFSSKTSPHDQLLSELKQLREASGTDPSVRAAASSPATLPFAGNHADIIGLQAASWRARGIPPFSAWVPPSPYDPLPYITEEPVPKAAGRGADVAAMRGETRAVAVNLVNARNSPIVATARVDGLPGCTDRPCLQAAATVWTDTGEGTAIALALRDVAQRAGGYAVQVASGLTTQLWFRIRPGPAMPAGDHHGRIVIETDAGERLEVPLAVHVAPFDFPAVHALHLGGWDYTDRQDLYGVTPNNRDALVTTLQEYLVDLPWASPSLLGPGRYDRDDVMIELPSTVAFDSWVSRWPSAYRYQVFVNAGDEFGGARIDTPAFRHKVTEWIRFWWARARARGLRAGQLALLLVDEPHTQAQDAGIAAWASVIKHATPDVLIWEDPLWEDPRQMAGALFGLCDIFCPPRARWLRGGSAFANAFLSHGVTGARLGLYSASGPSAQLDPYAYYQLQAWQAFAANAGEMGFWSFADNGGGSSWQPYVVPKISHSPLFLAPESVTPTKQMEAIRDGVEDYETLTMLRNAVARKRGHTASAAVADELLTNGVRHVLTAAGEGEFSAGVPRDRTLADQTRRAALRLLEQMGE